MLRTSSYTIYVDLPGDRGEMLLVHGYTGAYDKVSRRVASYLRSLESRRPPKPLYGEWTPEPPAAVAASGPPDDETLAVLKKRGYLTRFTPEEEEDFFTRFATRLHARAAQRMPSYIFMPSYDCNLRCGYCFQDAMRTDPSLAHLLGIMQPAMVDRIFAAMPQIEALHGVDASHRGRQSIGFFGGEPLLAAHHDIVARIMDLARERGPADFWAVTNGTELGAFRDRLGPQGIGRLQITLDGPPAEHDQRRIYADGSGSFARIARHITMALELGVVISVRLNIDHGNIGHLPQLAREIQAQGWDRHARFSAYTAPINAVNDKTDRRTTMNSWQLDRALTELRQTHPEVEIIGRPDEGIRARARQIFDGGEEIIPRFRPSFCGAHDQMYIFDRFGDIYACWERTGDAQIRIGRITPAGDVDMEHDLSRKWRSRTVASNPVCRRCRYALHCGGGCAILALGQRGKFHANYCDGFAQRFRASVAEAYTAFEAGEMSVRHHDRVCDL